jgi:hypothetical protein
VNAAAAEAACQHLADGYQTCRRLLSEVEEQADFSSITALMDDLQQRLAAIPSVPNDMDPSQAERCALLLRSADDDRTMCLAMLEILQQEETARQAETERASRAASAYRMEGHTQARFVDRQR